jgi:hypothetical protein
MTTALLNGPPKNHEAARGFTGPAGFLRPCDHLGGAGARSSFWVPFPASISRKGRLPHFKKAGKARRCWFDKSVQRMWPTAMPVTRRTA